MDNYLQIPKWRCAGNKDILEKVADALKGDKDFRFNDDGNIFLIEYEKKKTIKEKTNTEVPKENHGAGWRG